MAEIFGGRAERTDTMLLMVVDQSVTTLLALRAGVGGGRTVLLLVRMDMHARAKEKEEVFGALQALVVGSATPAAAIESTSLT